MLPDHLDLIFADRPVRGTVTKHRLKILRCSTTQFQKSFVPNETLFLIALPQQLQHLHSEASWALSYARRRAHLVALISLWRLTTTFQIQIQIQRHFVQNIVYMDVYCVYALHCIVYVCICVVFFCNASCCYGLRLSVLNKETNHLLTQYSK